MTHRRTLLTALGAGLLNAPLASFAQAPGNPPGNSPSNPAGAPGKIWRVGILGFPQRPASLDTHYAYGGILQGLRDHGYVEGKNLVIEWRFAGSDATRLPALAAELVQWQADVLVAAALAG